MSDSKFDPNQEYKSLLMAHIAEEEGLFRGIKLLGTILTLLFSVLCWVFVQKSDDIKAMQMTLNQHSLQINETLIILKAEIESNKRQDVEHEKFKEQMWKNRK